MRAHLAVLVAAAGLVAVPAAPAGAAAAPAWGPCTGVPEPTLGLQCATLDVPLDYAKPNGKTIKVAFSRLRNTDPRKRRGVLMLNPGGQFTSELGLPLRLVSLGLPASVRERYDLIGADPRGIGRSTPVTCDLRPDQMFFVPPPYARDAADVQRRAGEVRQVAEQCGRSATAPLLPHITTANVARDMDRIRAALGERKISYLGYSYGVYLGAIYSSLFPGRTDRVVLDSAVGPGGADYTWSRRFALGFEIRFPDFARFAAARNATYGLGSTPREVRAKFFELAGRLDKRPVGGVDGASFRFQTFSLLFTDASFPSLAELWKGLDQGIAGGRRLAQQDEFDFSGLLHLACNDSNWPSDVRVYQRNVARDRVRLPMFGAAGANIWACAFWPSEQLEPTPKISSRGPSNIMIVQNLRDPGTPIPGALQMRHALGDRARLLTVNQGGHLVYLFGHNSCANDRTTTYLVEGKRPADSFCPA